MKINCNKETENKANIIFIPVCDRCGYVFENFTINKYEILKPTICPNCERKIEIVKCINYSLIQDELYLEGKYEYTKEKIYGNY